MCDIAFVYLFLYLDSGYAVISVTCLLGWQRSHGSHFLIKTYIL